MTYLIDTDWVIDHLKGRGAARTWMPEPVRAGASISVITYGEVLEGLLSGGSTAKQEEGFRQFVPVVRLLPIERDVVTVWADLRRTLRRRGNLIPDADLLIAATAIHQGPALVTGNVDHFRCIDGLRLFLSPSDDT